MRRDDQRQAVKNIPLEQLKPFKNHPFQVRDDEDFRRLVESIEIHGVIHPAVARQIGEDCYELISGHRRKAACEVLGYSEMPVLVRSMTDDEAVVNMVDANLQRETILPSERAFAYKMKLVAMSHQGRKGFTSAQLGRKCVGKESREFIAEKVGQSRNQSSRYIRLTELIPEILEMVDNRKMALNPAVSISYLDKKQQKLLSGGDAAERAVRSRWPQPGLPCKGRRCKTSASRLGGCRWLYRHQLYHGGGLQGRLLLPGEAGRRLGQWLALHRW